MIKNINTRKNALTEAIHTDCAVIGNFKIVLLNYVPIYRPILQIHSQRKYSQMVPEIADAALVEIRVLQPRSQGYMCVLLEKHPFTH